VDESQDPHGTWRLKWQYSSKLIPKGLKLQVLHFTDKLNKGLQSEEQQDDSLVHSVPNYSLNLPLAE